MRIHIMRLVILAFVMTIVLGEIPPAGAQEQPVKIRVGLGDVSLNQSAVCDRL